MCARSCFIINFRDSAAPNVTKYIIRESCITGRDFNNLSHWTKLYPTSTLLIRTETEQVSLRVLIKIFYSIFTETLSEIRYTLHIM